MKDHRPPPARDSPAKDDAAARRGGGPHDSPHSTPTPGPSRLDVVQRWFHSVISHAGGVEAGIEAAESQELIRLRRDELERIILRSTKLSAQERVSIYANAYYARLVECLGESFPVLKRALGDEVWSGFASEYLKRHPPRSYTLARLGDGFAEFLAETRPDLEEGKDRPEATNWPDFLIDLATLEWTLGQVFDGPGVEGTVTLTAQDLQGVPPDRFAAARLVPVVCLRLLVFRYPVNAYFTAARQTPDEAPAVPAPATEAVAITRRDYVVRRYPLTLPQHALLGALCQGATVAEAIAKAAGLTAEDDLELAAQLRSWFQSWTQDGFFQAVELP